MGLPIRRASELIRPEWRPFAEPAAVFALIMIYIWWLRFRAPAAWIFIVAFLVLSHRRHGERARHLGFRIENLRRCAREMSPALFLIALALLGGGIVFRTTRPISFDQGLMAFAGYCPWGLFQQYLLNSYFTNRLAAIPPRRYAPLIAAALFSGAHLPNPFLMAVTLAAGYVCAKAYLKYRNLYFLGLAHGAIGFLLYLVVPDWISRNLSVGPGWFSR